MSERHRIEPPVTSIEGRLSAAGRRIGIVAARFNSRVVDLLLGAAVDCCERHGARRRDLRVVRVPGAWEVPLALEEMAASGKFDALVALAVVIRGETSHYDYICGECSSGVAGVGARYRIPVGFGVLTCETSRQAEERAGGKAGNKGWEAALAAIEMADLVDRLRADATPMSADTVAGRESNDGSEDRA